jgi:hypothetical protein
VQLALVLGRALATDDRVNLDQPLFDVRRGWLGTNGRPRHRLSQAKE